MFPLVPDPTAPPPAPTAPSAAAASAVGVAAFGSGLPQFAPSGIAMPSAPPDDRPAGGWEASAARRPGGPDAALAELVAGNARFASGRPRYGHSVAAARAVATAANPFAVIVGCMDARMPVEAIFDQDFGAVCVVRSAGHVLDRVTLASVEFGVTVLGSALVVVLGHRRCAAVSTAVQAWRTGDQPHGHLGYVAAEIGAAIHGTEPDRDDLAEVIARRHTDRSVARLRGLLGAGGARVVGASYDVDTGTVELT